LSEIFFSKMLSFQDNQGVRDFFYILYIGQHNRSF
jgi:hypothetical protein